MLKLEVLKGHFEQLILSNSTMNRTNTKEVLAKIFQKRLTENRTEVLQTKSQVNVDNVEHFICWLIGLQSKQ